MIILCPFTSKAERSFDVSMNEGFCLTLVCTHDKNENEVNPLNKKFSIIAMVALLASCGSLAPVAQGPVVSDGVLVKLALNTPVNVTTVSNGQPVRVTFSKTTSTPDLVLSFSGIQYTDGSPSVFRTTKLSSTTKKDDFGNPVQFTNSSIYHFDSTGVFGNSATPSQNQNCTPGAAPYLFCSNSFNLILGKDIPADSYEFIFYPTAGTTKVKVALSAPITQPL